MLKERGRILAAGILAVDLGLVACGFLLAFWLRSDVFPALGLARPEFYPLSVYLPLLPLGLVLWAALLLLSREYRSHRTVPLLQEAAAMVRVSIVAAALFTVAIYVLRLDEALLGRDKISRLWIVLFAAATCLLLLAEKIALRATSRYVRSRGYNYRTVLIVGTGPSGREIARSIEVHRYWGFRILGFITLDANGAGPAGPYPILGLPQDIPALLERTAVDDVIFAVSRKEFEQLEELFLGLQEQGIRTRFALNLFPHTQAKVELEELNGIPLLTFSTSPTSQVQLLLKRFVDVSLSALLLLLTFPVILAVAFAIKLSSRGSVLFRQTRCGLNGRRFTLYKFRTMVENAERQRQDLLHLNEMDGPVFKLKSDPRVTRVGRLLRRFSLDELPQLWNVLKGDMSLVGPRPPIPEEVTSYQRWQRRRLAMKPGLTCLWQISGRNEVDFERWMELDLEYIDTWTPILDLKILAKTIPVVLSGRGSY